MHTRTTAAITAALCTLLLAGCSSKPSYDQIADNCTKALAARADGDKVKPKECDGLKPDDYDTLLGNEVLRRMGALDKDGNLDPSKLLDPSATP